MDATKEQIAGMLSDPELVNPRVRVADLLSDEALAVLHARDGDWAPLIKRLRSAGRLGTGGGTPALSLSELECAADLLEKAQRPLKSGNPPALSTWWRDLLVTKFYAVGLLMRPKWPVYKIKQKIANRFGLKRDYVRKLLREGVSEEFDPPRD